MVVQELKLAIKRAYIVLLNPFVFGTEFSGEVIEIQLVNYILPSVSLVTLYAGPCGRAVFITEQATLTKEYKNKIKINWLPLQFCCSVHSFCFRYTFVCSTCSTWLYKLIIIDIFMFLHLAGELFEMFCCVVLSMLYVVTMGVELSLW